MTDHEDHWVERLNRRPINPPGGYPHDTFFCWTCGVGWDEWRSG